MDNYNGEKQDSNGSNINDGTKIADYFHIAKNIFSK